MNVKKHLKAVLLFFILITAGLLSFNIISRYHEQELSKQKRQQLPAFTFYTANLRPYHAQDLATDRNLILLYYDIECEACIAQIAEIEKNRATLGNINFILVSVNNPLAVQRFLIEHHNFYKMLQTSLYDTEHNFNFWFGITSTPTIFIYNKNHQLLKTYQGLVSAVKLLEYAK